jgi:hypothetical protein
VEKPESTGRQSIIHGVNWETTQTIYPVFKVELSQLTNSTTTSICKPNYSPEKYRTVIELFYSARGYTDDEFYLTDESGAVISNTYTCRTHYLDIPVLVKFFPYNGLNVQFGPQLGIGLSLSDKWKGINNDDYSIYRDSAVDFSLAFGLGYEFNFGVFVDARYTLGLTKTIKEVVKGFQGRNISLAVGYRVYL